MNETTDLAVDEPLQAVELTASLTVGDLERSLAWYRDVVGFSVTQRHERDGKLRAVSLRAGEVRLLLGQDDGARGLDRAKGEGFSLMITVDADVDAVANRITAAGGELDTPLSEAPWGARIFRVRDPDNFRLTFSTPRTPAGEAR